MHQSVWEEPSKMSDFPQFEGNATTDVLIIGGGLCGILCAYHLQKAGVQYILVEKNRIFDGTSKNSTGKITSQHGLIYSKLARIYGMETASMYLRANENAIKAYADMCTDIDCDFEYKNAYIYSVSSQRNIEKETEVVNRLGKRAKFVQNTELPFDIRGSICFENQAQFNPYKFAANITKELNIYENAFVHELTPTAAYIGNGCIKAEKFIVASHFPFINMYGGYFLKLYQHRSYMSSYSNAPLLNGMYADDNLSGISLRSYGKSLILCGSGHRTGQGGKAWKGLNDFVSRYYPAAVQEYRWAAQDCMSLDSMPYIGRYSNIIPNMYVASGFNKWGITSSMVSAQILTDLVCDRENQYSSIFSPQRKMHLPTLGANAFKSTVNMLTPTPRRCPHLGCALKWNKAEHTWDCPCHGSRFTGKGKLIDNPAIRDADINDSDD